MDVPSPDSGAHIGGDVGTGGGDFTGRDDRRVENDIIVNVDQSTLQTILYQLNRIENTFGREIEFIKRDIAETNRDIISVKEDMRLIRERQALLLEDVNDMKKNQYPRWFQILMIVMAAALILLGLFLTTKVLALSPAVGHVITTTYQR